MMWGARMRSFTDAPTYRVYWSKRGEVVRWWRRAYALQSAGPTCSPSRWLATRERVGGRTTSSTSSFGHAHNTSSLFHSKNSPRIVANVTVSWERKDQFLSFHWENLQYRWRTVANRTRSISVIAVFSIDISVKVHVRITSFWKNMFWERKHTSSCRIFLFFYSWSSNNESKDDNRVFGARGRLAHHHYPVQTIGSSGKQCRSHWQKTTHVHRGS